MKKFLAFLVMMSLASSLYAEKRIYLVYGNGTTNPLPTADNLVTTDLRPAIAIWKGGITGPGTDNQHWITVNASAAATDEWKCMIGEDPSKANVDLSGVTSAWSLHMELKTNYTGKFWFGMADVTADSPKFSYPLELTTDNTTWNQEDIAMSELFDMGLDYANNGNFSAGGTWRVLLYLQGNVPTAKIDGNEPEIWFDNIYFTDNDSSTSVNEISNTANTVKVRVANGIINVTNAPQGFAVYSVTGTKVAETASDNMDASNLAKGVYIVKANNSSSKIIL